MPLYKTITLDEVTKVLIWKIEEDFEWLSKDVKLTTHCQNRVDGMKSVLHKRGFMSVRHLLLEAGYTDFDLFYDEFGKPHLKDGKEISITHSYNFSGIIVGNSPVGIDIEKQREKILRIARKFTPIEEYRTLANDEAVMRKLTIVWCAKEAIYKLYNKQGLGFLEHINVRDFDFEIQKTTAEVNFENAHSEYTIDFLEFEGFTCGYALPKA